MDKIGQGSYGEVFRNGQFAYKYIHKVASDGIPLNGATREIVALKYLNHPNIIKGTIGSTDEDIVIKMKYYPYTLSDRFCYSKEEHIIIYMHQLIQACAYMEQAGFMHRDLKPANILIGSNLVVADFSLGIWAREGSYSNVQTIHYRAPEVFACQKYTSKIDVWSVGIILYEMLTNTNLQLQENVSSIEILAANIGISKSEASLFRQNNKCQFPTKEYKNTWFSKCGLLGDLCMKMLSFNPEYRVTFAECLQHPVFSKMSKTQIDQQYNAENIIQTIKSKKQTESDDVVEFIIKQITSDEDEEMVSEKDVFALLRR